ncbi:AzlD domain-containing protein [Aestuariivirga litoralis]|uniref:AzlD domain-containing protein n=1 Tax=Aestuariivirga litoralis TaxID=2650924 RepID=UPI0018C6B505|nr:AzlD domain-containing protein [Aestuariivirga litoralis]MBG1232813.1 hypothetical protein [Aestuariivirga litoralis]
MTDWHIIAAVCCVGLVAYALRTGGYLTAGLLPADSQAQRFLRLAPANLFVAFVAASCFAGGITNVVGALVALVTMLVTKRQWAGLIMGFVAAALVAILRG